LQIDSREQELQPLVEQWSGAVGKHAYTAAPQPTAQPHDSCCAAAGATTAACQWQEHSAMIIGLHQNATPPPELIDWAD
jgi:hypothetical protein